MAKEEKKHGVNAPYESVQALYSGEKARRLHKTAHNLAVLPPSHTDPDGSYTGRPAEEWETPQQDADDL